MPHPKKIAALGTGLIKGMMVVVIYSRKNKAGYFLGGWHLGGGPPLNFHDEWQLQLTTSYTKYYEPPSTTRLFFQKIPGVL